MGRAASVALEVGTRSGYCFAMTKVTRFTVDNDAGGDKRRLHLREISGESDAPLGTVGQDLRAARLRLGDDLATVSGVLKIRKDHLEALEEDRLEALPGRTYAVGFVRSYATYLGLDAGEYLERFKEEIAGRTDATYLTPYIEQSDRRLPQGWQVIAVAFVALLILGLIRWRRRSAPNRLRPWRRFLPKSSIQPSRWSRRPLPRRFRRRLSPRPRSRHPPR